jgi:ADP-heptose:LPS heptosyltransferase
MFKNKESELYYVALQALGDNLISLCLLKELNEDIEIIGTKSTSEICSLIVVGHQLSVDVLYDEIPSFYNFRKKSAFKIINDIIRFRRFVKSKKVKTLIFEKNDFRIKILTFGLSVKTYSVDKFENVYLSRKKMLEECFGKKINFDFEFFEPTNYKTVLINPITRLKEKNITSEDLFKLICFLRQKSFFVQLVDYDGSYSKFNVCVDEYISGTSLSDISDLIKSCDLYLGADSFLIHLAYFYKKHFFIIFNHRNDSFLPPISLTLKNYIVISESEDFVLELDTKFKKMGYLN